MSSISPNQRGIGAGAFIAAVVVTAGVSGAMLTRSVKAAEPKPGQPNITATSPSPAPIGDRTAVLAEIENGFATIAEHLEPSVVSIHVKKTVSAGGAGSPMQFMPFGGGDDNDMPQIPGLRRFRGGQGFQGAPRDYKMEGSGSGVIVRNDGWILTNDHVVDGADKVTVKLRDGREFDGQVRRDYRSDIALIKINASGLTAAEFADSDKLRVGQWAIAFGSPFNLEDTMTVGIVSAQSRQKAIAEGGAARFYPSLIQTDASVNPGNSGGPLVDSRGRVMGINVAINSPSGGSVGIGFAIPANIAKNVMEQLINNGKVSRGFLGVMPSSLTPDERNRYGVAQGGALIREVSEDTPASKAGLMVEDVVLSIDGHAIKDDFDLRQTVSAKAAGTKAQFVVKRGNAQKTITVTIEAAKDEIAQAQKPAVEAQTGKLGIRTETVTAESAKRFGIEGVTAGALVAEVDPNGPAADAGIQPGHVILRANGQPVNSGLDLAKITKEANGKVSLDVLQGKTRRLIIVDLN